MKYMLIMNTPRDGYTQYLSWPKKILEANIAFMHALNKKLKDAGELVGAEGLAAPTGILNQDRPGGVPPIAVAHHGWSW